MSETQPELPAATGMPQSRALSMSNVPADNRRTVSRSCGVLDVSQALVRPDYPRLDATPIRTPHIPDLQPQAQPWAIYSSSPNGWPRSPGRMFVAAAAAALEETLFDISTWDIDPETPSTIGADLVDVEP